MNKLEINGRKYPMVWSSTENSANFAWLRTFGDGVQYDGSKAGIFWVRPIRRVKK